MFKKCIFSLLMVGLVLSAQNASAYLVATEPARLNPNVATDIFIAGFGGDQGNQFTHSAVLGARISRDRFPARQRVIIAAVNDSAGYEGSLLEKGGLNLRRADKDGLTGERLVATLNSLGVRASSMQFYGHANTYNGFRLQTKYKRLDHDDDSFAALGRFIRTDGFAVIHSCNSAWLLAPTAARLWNRPVFGSFAGSNFQNLKSDGQWYYNDPGFYPGNLSWKSSTSQLTQNTLSCADGRCVRLKPVNIPYHDSFGRFSRGLGFYKVFAPDATQIPRALVHLTMLYPTKSPATPSSTRVEFATALADWMCPSDKSMEKYNACKAAIVNEEFRSKPFLSYFSGTPIACNNTSCNTKVKCKAFKVVFSVPCKTYDVAEGRSTVFSDTLKQAFAGFDDMKNGGFSLR
ncbi:hypothetical protein [Bdellovibrio sp. HCB209]|uniref:hypothetical protein n=1 Tax=Bdellovibrio sp. HCB209 TaxID=3394354 RepID=UPI0039B4BAB3